MNGVADAARRDSVTGLTDIECPCRVAGHDGLHPVEVVPVTKGGHAIIRRSDREVEEGLADVEFFMNRTYGRGDRQGRP